jgi:hypothetical protein
MMNGVKRTPAGWVTRNPYRASPTMFVLRCLTPRVKLLRWILCGTTLVGTETELVD